MLILLLHIKVLQSSVSDNVSGYNYLPIHSHLVYNRHNRIWGVVHSSMCTVQPTEECS